MFIAIETKGVDHLSNFKFHRIELNYRKMQGSEKNAMASIRDLDQTEATEFFLANPVDIITILIIHGSLLKSYIGSLNTSSPYIWIMTQFDPALMNSDCNKLVRFAIKTSTGIFRFWALVSESPGRFYERGKQQFAGRYAFRLRAMSRQDVPPSLLRLADHHDPTASDCNKLAFFRKDKKYAIDGTIVTGKCCESPPISDRSSTCTFTTIDSAPTRPFVAICSAPRAPAVVEIPVIEPASNVPMEIPAVPTHQPVLPSLDPETCELVRQAAKEKAQKEIKMAFAAIPKEDIDRWRQEAIDECLAVKKFDKTEND